jgi:hypothetical protein
MSFIELVFFTAAGAQSPSPYTSRQSAMADTGFDKPWRIRPGFEPVPGVRPPEIQMPVIHFDLHCGKEIHEAFSLVEVILAPMYLSQP